MPLYFYYIGVNMIRNINGGGRYISVSGGNPSFPYISPGSTGAGMVRWNSNMNTFEVNDGSMWKSLTMDFTTVQMSPVAESAIDWALKKMNEERDLEELCKRFPGLEKARNNFEMFRRLAESALTDGSDQVQSSP
jgi:hypothetical protein